MAAALYVLLSLMQYAFLFTMDMLRMTQVVQLFLYLQLKSYEAKIQMLLVFSWNPAQPRYVTMNILSFLKAYNTTHYARGLRPRLNGEKLSRVEGSPALPSQLLTTVYMSKVVPVDRVKVNPTKLFIGPA